jgi:hypothetical protein
MNLKIDATRSALGDTKGMLLWLNAKPTTKNHASTGDRLNDVGRPSQTSHQQRLAYWAEPYFLTGTSQLEDPDNDGFSNSVEYTSAAIRSSETPTHSPITPPGTSSGSPFLAMMPAKTA